jgi:DnaA family protein
MAQLALDLLRAQQPAFDNFVPGRSADAVEVLRRLARGESTETIVYLWGEPGSGRSHLLQALAAAGAAVWQPGQPPEQPGLSVVDDVDALDAAGQIALFNRLNAVRAQPGCACVVAGPLAPSRLALREDLRTRLGWGLVFQLHPLTDQQKAGALRAHAAATGLTLPEDVLAYLLGRFPRDMRTLVAALDALDAYALARKRPLTLALLRDWLGTRQSADPAADPAAAPQVPPPHP